MRSSATFRGRAAAVVVALAGGLGGGLAACGSDKAASTADLTPEQVEGLRLAQSAGCSACHGGDFSGGVAPGWRGLAGSQVPLADGTTVVADDAYLTESIADPSAKIRAGSTTAMPDNHLDADQIAKIVAYIHALSGEGAAAAG